jgi:hypothetical protein
VEANPASIAPPSFVFAVCPRKGRGRVFAARLRRPHVVGVVRRCREHAFSWQQETMNNRYEPYCISINISLFAFATLKNAHLKVRGKGKLS